MPSSSTPGSGASGQLWSGLRRAVLGLLNDLTHHAAIREGASGKTCSRAGLGISPHAARCPDCAGRRDAVGVLGRRENARSSGAGHCGRGALLHFVWRDVFDVGGDIPLMAERVLKLAGAVAIELVLHRAQRCGASVHCSLERGI